MRDLRVHILYSVGHQGCVENLSAPVSDHRLRVKTRRDVFSFLLFTLFQKTRKHCFGVRTLVFHDYRTCQVQ